MTTSLVFLPSLTYGAMLKTLHSGEQKSFWPENTPGPVKSNVAEEMLY
jgi:hypothetical protein